MQLKYLRELTIREIDVLESKKSIIDLMTRKINFIRKIIDEKVK